MEKEFKYPTTAQLMSIIARATFRPFTKLDWYSFSGCESANPLIFESDEYTIVIDGNNINMVYHEDEYGGMGYSLQEGF